MHAQKRILIRKQQQKKSPNETNLIKNKLEKPSDISNKEGNFINIIALKIKNSKRCLTCSYFRNPHKDSYFCSNFEAIWYHRDNNFKAFGSCSFFKI